jgi:hypothetical protein
LLLFLICYGIVIHIPIVVDSLQSVHTKKDELYITRRRVLGNGIACIIGSSTTTNTMVDSAYAVAPITQTETETGMSKVMRLLRNNPPKILRQRLAQDFAVLLMRTSYSIVDELDIIPMNQFQRDFFLIRTAEYEPYIQSLGPGYVQQGDLTDPSYFDFISFAQFLTINRALSDPAFVFEGLKPVENPDNRTDDNMSTKQQFKPVIVRRTISNDQLIPFFDESFGTTLLRYFDDVYGNTPSALTINDLSSNNRPSISAVQESLTQLVKLFLINGFAWDGRVEVSNRRRGNDDDDASDTTFCIILDSPASLWGNEALHRQRSKLSNDYILKVAKQLIQQRTRYKITSSTVRFQNNSEMNYITIK